MKRAALDIVRALTMTLALPGLAWSHERFLRPADHYPPVNSPVSVTLVSGKFDKSENAVARDRLADASVLAAGKVTHPQPVPWHDADNAAHLKLPTGAEGTYMVRVSTKARLIELSAEDFDAYLHHEGIEDTLVQAQGQDHQDQHVGDIIDDSPLERLVHHGKIRSRIIEKVQMRIWRCRAGSARQGPVNECHM